MRNALSTRQSQPFWDRAASKYARKSIDDPAAYEEKLTKVGSLLQSTDRVLEIGCGTGSTALRLGPAVAHYIATDGSQGMIGIAQSKLGFDAPTNVSFQQADAADMIEGHPFDAICAFSLLHLVRDVPQVLNRVHDQLKPGGLFISKTVCLKDASVLLRPLVGVLMAVGYAPHVTFLSCDDLTRQLRATGFEIEQVIYFGANRTNPFIVARRTAA